MPTRICSRATCRQYAAWTLTYDYAESTAVIGPLSLRAEPHGYDLCPGHAHRLSVPEGWRIVRYADFAETGEHE